MNKIYQINQYRWYYPNDFWGDYRKTPPKNRIEQFVETVSTYLDKNKAEIEFQKIQKENKRKRSWERKCRFCPFVRGTNSLVLLGEGFPYLTVEEAIKNNPNFHCKKSELEALELSDPIVGVICANDKSYSDLYFFKLEEVEVIE